MILLDTSVIIGTMERTNQQPDILDVLRSLESDDDCLVAAVTLGELRHAVLAAEPPMIEQRTQTYEFAATFRCAVVSDDFETIEAYANARTEKPRCQTNDTWIIALARQHQATLYTEDADMARLARTMNVETVLCTSAAARRRQRSSDPS